MEICIEIFTYFTEHCNEIEKISQNEYSCKQCKVDAYPMLIPKIDFCIETNEDHLDYFPFCSRFEIVNEEFTCIECETGLIFDPIYSSCETYCIDTHLIASLDFSTTNYSVKKNIHQCLDIGLDNCEKAIQVNENNVEEFVCILCMENEFGERMPHVSFEANHFTTTKTHIAHLSRFTTDKISYNFLNRFNPLLCGHTGDGEINYNIAENFDEIDRCDLYTHEIIQVDEEDFNLYKCIRCKIGYTGITMDGYIEECGTEIEDCDYTLEYKNLLSPLNGKVESGKEPLNLYASCYKCEDEKIPVLFMKKGTTNYEFIEFEFDSDSGILTNCLDKTKEAFVIDENDPLDFVGNCGFYLYLLDMDVSGDISNLETLSIKCAACAPGYKPTFDTETITACTAIENCKMDSINNAFYNSCGECDDEYFFGWIDSDKTFDNTICQKYNKDNCIVYNETDSECNICKDGYLLNQDKVCEQVNIPLCKTGSFVTSFYEYSQ